MVGDGNAQLPASSVGVPTKMYGGGAFVARHEPGAVTAPRTTLGPVVHPASVHCVTVAVQLAPVNVGAPQLHCAGAADRVWNATTSFEL